MPKFDEIADESLARTESGPVRVCANCGAKVREDEWHPVSVENGDEFLVYLFCRQRCLEEWQDR